MIDYRINEFKCLNTVTCSRRKGFVLTSCLKGYEKGLEYELEKTKRKDKYCEWEYIVEL